MEEFEISEYKDLKRLAAHYWEPSELDDFIDSVKYHDAGSTGRRAIKAPHARDPSPYAITWLLTKAEFGLIRGLYWELRSLISTYRHLSHFAARTVYRSFIKVLSGSRSSDSFRV